jgi:hypothetical protein
MVYLLLKLKYLEIEYKNQYIYIHTHRIHHLHQPTGHRPNQPRSHPARRDQADRLHEPAPHGMEDVRSRVPCTAPILTPRSRNEPTRLDRVNLPRTPHVTQPFFLVVQSFYYIVNYFTITNSANFARVNSAILSHILEIISQSFS